MTHLEFTEAVKKLTEEAHVVIEELMAAAEKTKHLAKEVAELLEEYRQHIQAELRKLLHIHLDENKEE